MFLFGTSLFMANHYPFHKERMDGMERAQKS